MSALQDLGRAARAYPTLLRVGLAEAVAYRAEMLVWMLTTTMPLVSLALWSAVAETAPVGRFTQQGFAAYFLATLLVRQLTGSWLVWELNQDIRSGMLSRRLLRPIHPLIGYSATNLAAIPLRAALIAPPAIVWLLVLEPGAFPRTPLTLITAALSIVGAWLINFFIMALIGSIAFYLESSTAIFDLWMVGFMLLSGYLVPLELFPAGLRAVAHALPFRYVLAFPVEILTGLLRDDQGDAILRELGIQWLYVIGAGSAAIAAFNTGVRRFSAFGG